jgi:hypothetical protein
MAESEWDTVARRQKVKVHHHFSEEAARRIESRLNCRNLAISLRSSAFEQEWADGWELASLRKGPPAAGTSAVGAPISQSEMLIPESDLGSAARSVSDYEFKLVAVHNNRWGDTVILRRLKATK